MNHPKSQSTIQPGRLIVEFVVIVIGVLVALVAENWWSDRDERIFEAELREDMIEEFQSNFTILESDLSANNAVFADLVLFVELSDEEFLALPHIEFSKYASGYIDWDGFDPMMGSVQALVQSGNLGAISDRELRARLSIWSGLLQEKTRFTDNAVNLQNLVLFPTAARFGADNVWSPEERRELRSLLRAFIYGMETAIQNQQRLQQAAQELTDYLRG